MAHHWIATRPGDLDVFVFEEFDPPPVGRDEVRIEVRAAGVNPADAKHVQQGQGGEYPRAVGYEVAGVVAAVGSEVGHVQVGQEVLAFRVSGGWTDLLTVAGDAVLPKPAALSFPEAANLLLAGTTAAEMLHVTDVGQGDAILVHGASGAVGVSVLQQAALLGARVIGTASESSFDVVRRFGGEPVAYGDGLEQRVRDLLGDTALAAALDCVGTDEAVDVSLALIGEDRRYERMVTIAAFDRAEADGFRVIAGSKPDSQAYRDAVRAHLVDLAADGRLVVPMADTFPLAQALDAARVLADQHPGGKLALVP